MLVEQRVDLAVEDLDAWWMFVNLSREPRFRPLRAETVAALVRRLRRQLAGRVPQRWTPHWFRHTHATALLLAGTPLHVVSRRLGHRDVQTTMNLYAWVTEDAELRAVADWRKFTEGCRAVARLAECSPDFLYRTPQLWSRIKALRTEPRRAAPPLRATESTNGVVRELAAQLADEKRRRREEVAALEAALAKAHGESLQLRRLGANHVRAARD